MENKLAIQGGKPVRDKPLPANYPGALVMGEEEAQAASRIIHAQSPFRFYGENMQHAAAELESLMSEDLQVPYVLGVTSCTAALVVALKALGVGYGDKVIIPAVTFIATAGAVISANAVPIFVDVDESLNMDPNDLERVMDEDVKAIITVPILGTPCDMDNIMAFAKKHNIAVIEDVAQSSGVMYKGKPQGTIGDINVFSFQMNKTITSGEGGAVTTHDPLLFERAVRYHDQGLYRPYFREKYDHEPQDEDAAFAGQNYRMSEITAAVVVEQWNKLDSILKPMKASHTRIKEQLTKQLPGLTFRKSIDPEGDLGANIGILFDTVEQSEQFGEALRAENVSAIQLYAGKPVYTLPQIRNMKSAEKDGFPFNYPFKKPVSYEDGICPRAEDLLPRMVFIPISSFLTEQDEQDIVTAVVKVWNHIMQ